MRHLSIWFILIILCLSCRQNKIIQGLVGNAIDLAIDTIKQNSNQNPDLILVIGFTKMVLDSAKIQKINPDWIDRVEVMKSTRAKSLFTDTIKVIYVYPKRKYHSKIKRLFRTTGIIYSYHDSFVMMTNSPKC
jgi:hypothetical protein